MTEYRKRKDGHDTWHMCRNCNNDPKENYETSYTRPHGSGQELCQTCLSKERLNDCD